MKIACHVLFAALVTLLLGSAMGCSTVVSAGDDPKFSAHMDSAARNISTELHADFYTFYSFRDFDSTTTNYIELTFTGISEIVDSAAAYQAIRNSVFWIFDALPDSVRLDYARYFVTVEGNGNSFSDTISSNEVGWAHLLSIIVHGAFSREDSCYTCFDPRFYTPQFADSLYDLLETVLPGTGKIEHHINGFFPNVLNGNEQLTGYWVTAGRGQYIRRFIIYVSWPSSQVVGLHMLDN